MNHSSTIFAAASALGKSGVAVFRISGPKASEVILRLCEPSEVPAARVASLRIIKNPQTREPIDRALILLFPAPHSFTGEDVVELHTHGGRAVTNAVIECLRMLPGFRLAEPGEFTRRAFENGKMDLTEVEAIADLVHAETEAQRRQALHQLEGALGRLYEGWRGRLAKNLAYIEAIIDFADEELPQDVFEKQGTELQILRDEIAAHLRDGHRGERMREGVSIAIVGPPNAGKSSLFNALARREAAIVSPHAGTTRDVIEVHLDVGGYPVILADSAGLRDADDSIESEGIRRAYLQAARADIKLLILDATAASLNQALCSIIDTDTIVVMNKVDLTSAIQNSGLTEKYSLIEPPIFLSTLTGVGLDELLKKLINLITQRFAGTHASPPLTRVRHRDALEECEEHLNRAGRALEADLRAEDVRLAMRALGRITGRVDVEDLLDIIFRDFCIGK